MVALNTGNTGSVYASVNPSLVVSCVSNQANTPPTFTTTITITDATQSETNDLMTRSQQLVTESMANSL